MYRTKKVKSLIKSFSTVFIIYRFSPLVKPMIKKRDYKIF